MTAQPRPSRLALRIWPRIRAFGALRLLLILIALGAFAYLWLRERGRFPEATVWQVPLVLELLLLSLPWRVVSFGMVARFFLIGFGPIFLATVVTQALLVASPLHDALRRLSSEFAQSGIGLLGNVHATVWASITEEIWKVVPVLLLAVWGRSRLWTQGGPLDFAILAAATGAGMGFAEDLLVINTLGWSVPSSPLLGLGVGTAYVGLVVSPLNAVPVNVTELDLGFQGLVSILDPSVRGSSQTAVWAGHGIPPLLFGLALGWVSMRRRGPTRRIALLVPIVVLLWSIWHHFVSNWYRAQACPGADEPALCGLARLDLTGALFPLAAIAFWVLATIAARRLIARHGTTDPAISVPRSDLSTAAYRGMTITWPLRFVADLLRFVRTRNRVAFAAARGSVETLPERQHAHDLAARLRRAQRE